MSKTLTTQQALRYNRQIVLPEFDLDGQEALLNARVLLIGVGGLGCACAQYLVAAGVGQLTLVDDDVVEAHNLQRQVLHSEADVGRFKVDSACDSLRGLNSEVVLRPLARRLDEQALQEEASQHHLIIDCTDNLDTRCAINRASLCTQTPLVSGAAIRFEGQVSTFVPGPEQPCYECLCSLFGEQQLSCVEAGIMAPVVGIIGSIQALEAINLLSKRPDTLCGKVMLFDGNTMRWQTFGLNKRSGCKACGSESG